MLLGKKMDYQEECVLKRINYKLFFNERTTLKSSADTYRKSFLSLGDRTFSKYKVGWEERDFQKPRIHFFLYWYCLNRTKTLKTGGFFQTEVASKEESSI